MCNTNLAHAINDNITFIQFTSISFLFFFHCTNRSIDISQYSVFGTQILMSQFHLDYLYKWLFETWKIFKLFNLI